MSNEQDVQVATHLMEYETKNRRAQQVAEVNDWLQESGYADLPTLQGQLRRQANDELEAAAAVVRPPDA